MNVIGLDGKPYKIQLKDYIVSLNDDRPRSSLHLRARKLIHSIFSTTVCEEVYVPGNDGLYLDFLMPTRKVSVETHGQQHYSFNSFMHGSRAGFAKAKKRDADKKMWCELNNITLIELPFDEDDNEWTKRLLA